MKMLVPAGLAAALLLTAGPAAAQANARCDRACLNDHTDRYLGALLMHDPGALALAPDVDLAVTTTPFIESCER